MIPIISHSGTLRTASNSLNDGLSFADPVTIEGALQPLTTGVKVVEMGIEDQTRHRLFLNPMSETDLARWTLGSRVELVPVGSSISPRKFKVDSRPLNHEGLAELDHVEVVLSEDYYE